ncbi:MAG: hypothetical protein QOC89_3383 [Paraburkholderia sp.]|nr:hypothetical protein [Paraburkholderia sp.]
MRAIWINAVADAGADAVTNAVTNSAVYLVANLRLAYGLAGWIRRRRRTVTE